MDEWSLMMTSYLPTAKSYLIVVVGVDTVDDVRAVVT